MKSNTLFALAVVSGDSVACPGMEVAEAPALCRCSANAARAQLPARSCNNGQIRDSHCLLCENCYICTQDDQGMMGFGLLRG